MIGQLISVPRRLVEELLWFAGRAQELGKAQFIHESDGPLWVEPGDDDHEQLTLF